MAAQPSPQTHSAGAGQAPVPHSMVGAFGVVIVIGAVFVVTVLELGSAGKLTTEYVTTEVNTSGTDPLPPHLPDVLRVDWWVIVALGAVLVTATTLAARLASTDRAKVVARFGLLMSLFVVLAAACENALLYQLADGETWLRNAVAGAATIKYCALVPAIAVAACGLALVPVRAARWWFNCRRTRWAHNVHRPVNEPTVVNQARWARGFTVPDAFEHAKAAIEADKAVVGICLSGGGVRAASVALGAMQSLFETREPREGEPVESAPVDPDYVVSVSGGGYAAGAIVQSLHGPKGGQPLVNALGETFTPGSPELDYLRRHSSYIADSVSSMLKALVVVAQKLCLSLALLFLPAVVLGVLAGVFYATFPIQMVKPTTEGGWGVNAVAASWAIAALVVPVLALGMLILGKQIFWLGAGVWFDRYATKGLHVFLGLAGCVVALVLVIPGLIYGTTRVAAATAGPGPEFAAGSALALNYVAALVVMGWRNRKVVATTVSDLAGDGRGRLARMLPQGALRSTLMLVTLAVVGSALLLTMGAVAGEVYASFPGNPAMSWRTLVIAAGALAVLGALDVTSLSLHPFYRRRLAHAFAVRRVRDRNRVTAVAYPRSEVTTLSEYGRLRAPGGRKDTRFVFAAAATLSGHDRPAPGLNAVSFTMDANYIGGPDIGWTNTAALERAATPRLRRDLTVQSAVALSGAAIGSAMGRMNRWYQKLLVVSGVRLGAWLPNPRFIASSDEGGADWTRPHGMPWMRGPSYLVRELFGINDGSARLLQISDGGHYENLGLVEALRRRCTLIYCIGRER